MKKKALTAALALLLTLGCFPARADSPASREVGGALDLLPQQGGYYEYLEGYKDKGRSPDSIDLTHDLVIASENARRDEIDGIPVWLTEENSVLSFAFTVGREGLYNLYFEYYTLKTGNAGAERRIEIDGDVPFEEAANISFACTYKDDVEYKDGFAFGGDGNELRPSQVQVPMWQARYARDAAGYFSDPFEFYLTAGKHTLTVKGTDEPLALSKITFKTMPAAPSYSQVRQQYAKEGRLPAQGDEVYVIQAENALYKSDSTLVACFDRSSAATTPFSADRILLNTIGGARWKYPGQWISWKAAVPKDGLYRIGARLRQNFTSGQTVARRLLINGELPFAEAADLRFSYDGSWQSRVFGDENGDWLFYLKAGDVITLEAALGDISELLRAVEDSIYNLNHIYRQILMITGPNPDAYRDYDLDLRIPDELERLAQESRRLKNIVRQIEELGNRSQSFTSAIQRMIVRIDNMLENISDIPRKFTDFQSSIVALGAWLLSAKEQPLELDTIMLLEENASVPKAEKGFFENIGYGFRMFLSSFYADYNVQGRAEGGERINVWIASGRDQAQIISQLCDNHFTENTGIDVNVRLVAAGSLLPAVLTGKGPDVHLSAAMNEPMNYGMRGAVRRLNDLPGFGEVAARFYPSALVPYTYGGDTYALPETQSFALLFYRKDILSELGIDKIDTWDDVYGIIPELAKKNLSFGLPAFSSTVGNAIDLSTYWTLLFQRGGKVYSDDAKRIAIDSRTGISAFRQWCEFYTNYTLYHTYDFPTYFRSGRIPVAIADYTSYNLLSIFAPEIKGLWDIAPIPATRNPDGSLDRTVYSGGTATEMMTTTKKPQEAWAFMKWWCESDTQVTYGRELESVMGTAARYPVSNRDALDQMLWTAAQAKVLKAQWEHTQGVPEVPGGYLKDREISFALRAVLTYGAEPREALTDHIFNINLEIEKMRIEFGLD